MQCGQKPRDPPERLHRDGLPVNSHPACISSVVKLQLPSTSTPALHRTSLNFPAPSAISGSFAAAEAVVAVGRSVAAESASGMLQRVSLVAAKLQQLEARRGFTGSAKPVRGGGVFWA